MNKETIEKLLDLVERHGGHTLSANCETCVEITELKLELFEDVAKALLFDALQKENSDLIANVGQSRALISIMENESKRDKQIIFELKERIENLPEELVATQEMVKRGIRYRHNVELREAILKQTIEKIEKYIKKAKGNCSWCSSLSEIDKIMRNEKK